MRIKAWEVRGEMMHSSYHCLLVISEVFLDPERLVPSLALDSNASLLPCGQLESTLIFHVEHDLGSLCIRLKFPRGRRALHPAAHVDSVPKDAIPEKITLRTSENIYTVDSMEA